MVKNIAIFIVVAVAAYLIFWQGKPVVDAMMTTEISTLLKAPGQYDGRQVAVSGNVVKSAAVFGVGGYTLGQDGAELFVVTTSGAPEAGTRVTVRGTFKQAVALNNLQYSVILEKK